MDSGVIDHGPPSEDDTIVEDEMEIKVYCWRLEQLLDAGYSRATADALAGDPAVDLHRACDLLASGCVEETAFLILS